MNTTQFGKILGVGGGLTALIWTLNKKQSAGKVVLFTGIFAVAGIIVGNTITKFYE